MFHIFLKSENVFHIFIPLKYAKAFRNIKYPKNWIFYRFKKSAWVEIFGSKKSTYLGKGGYMVALVNPVNFSIEVPCWNPWYSAYFS
jgi:hypothetical protein